MATTPASLIPATSNGQTASQLAETSGVSQAEAMAEQSKYPDLNPDAIIGNVLSRRTSEAAGKTVATVPPPVSVSGSQAEAQFVKDGNALSDVASQRSSATANPTQYAEPTQTDTSVEQTPEARQLADLSAQYDTDYRAATSKLDALQATADEQNAQLIQSIKDQYAVRKQQMEQTNRGLVASTTQAGIRAGRNVYAPEMEASMITAAEQDGIQRLSALDAEQSSLILQAQMAKNDKDFERLNASIGMLRDNADRKRQAVLDLHQLQQDADAELRAKAQEKRAQAQFEFDVQQAKDKPVQEASKAAQEHLYDLGLKYPDAGILSTDTVEAATEKIRNSPAYKADLAYTLAQAAAKNEAGATVSDTTIRSFAQSLLQNGLATNPYEADKMARDYYQNGYVPEQSGPAGSGGKATLDAARGMASFNSEAQQGALLRSVNEKMAKGDVLGATSDVYRSATASLPTTQRDKAIGYIQSLNNLDDIERLLAEYKAEGGNTGIFNGTEKAISDALRKTNDPKLLEIGNRITLAMTDYRRAQSGAAFTASEEKLYKAAFPSTFGSEAYNAGKIAALRDAFNVGLKSQLESVVGKENYAQMEGSRQAVKDAPELRKSAVKNGYEASDVDEAIKAGYTKSEIEEAMRSPKSSAGSDATDARKMEEISIGGRTVKVSSSIASRLASADADFFRATGQHLKINEGLRSRERQAELYAKYRSGTGGRAAPPGKSFHETGMAVDVANWKEAEKYLRKYGLRNDLADDRNHFSLNEFNA